ncbi:MAG: 30S ribosomal protein S6 [Proteobacteria bacterium]|nr:30S ribosomal protein S6 [Pseudomonadota bacterium]
MLQSMRDQPGTQREYETIYILRPEATSEQLQQANERIREVIEKSSGKLLRVENWGKRKLAYEIEKHHKGIYLYWRYLAPPQLVAEVERNLRLMDLVIRYLSIKVDADVDPNARPSDVTGETFVAAAETRLDEEDYYLGRAADDDDSDGERGEGDDDDEGEDDEVRPRKRTVAPSEKPAAAAASAEAGEADAEAASAEKVDADGAEQPADDASGAAATSADGEEA